MASSGKQLEISGIDWLSFYSLIETVGTRGHQTSEDRGRTTRKDKLLGVFTVGES
jgi:hypothetical protein